MASQWEILRGYFNWPLQLKDFEMLLLGQAVLNPIEPNFKLHP